MSPVILRVPVLYYFANWAVRKRGGALSLPECRPPNPDASAGLRLPVAPLLAAKWQAEWRARKADGSILFADFDASCAAAKEVAACRQALQGAEALPKAWELALKQRPKEKGDFSADLTKLAQVPDADAAWAAGHLATLCQDFPLPAKGTHLIAGVSTAAGLVASARVAWQACPPAYQSLMRTELEKYLELITASFSLATTTASEVNDTLVALQPHLSKLPMQPPQQIAEPTVKIVLTEGLSTAVLAAMTKATSVDTLRPAVMKAVHAAKSKQELDCLKKAVVKACTPQTAVAFDWFLTGGLQPSPQPAPPTAYPIPHPSLLLGTHQLVAGGAVQGAAVSAALAPYPGQPTAVVGPGVGRLLAAPAAAGQQVVRVSSLSGPPRSRLVLC